MSVGALVPATAEHAHSHGADVFGHAREPGASERARAIEDGAEEREQVLVGRRQRVDGDVHDDAHQRDVLGAALRRQGQELRHGVGLGRLLAREEGEEAALLLRHQVGQQA